MVTTIRVTFTYPVKCFAGIIEQVSSRIVMTLVLRVTILYVQFCHYCEVTGRVFVGSTRIGGLYGQMEFTHIWRCYAIPGILYIVGSVRALSWRARSVTHSSVSPASLKITHDQKHYQTW